MRVGTVVSCAPCGGRGVVRALDLTQPRRVWQIATCPGCAGTGAYIVKEVRA